jgi:PKD repeat protein
MSKCKRACAFYSRTGALYSNSGQEVIFKSAYSSAGEPATAPRARFTSNPTLTNMAKTSAGGPNHRS